MPFLRSLVLLAIVSAAVHPSNPPLHKGGQGGVERRVDAEGDPLPAGVLARLGSARFRQGSPATCVAFARDGKMIATGSSDGVVRLWSVVTGLEIRHCSGHSGRITAVRFARNDHYLVSASQDGSLRLWDVSSGDEARTFSGHQSGVLCLAVSSDDKTLYSGGSDRVVRVWEIESGKETQQILGHRAQITGLDLSPDDKQLATASNDGTMRLWDLTNTKEVVNFDIAKSGPSFRAAFSADGGLVFGATSSDGGLRSWNPATGKETRRYPTKPLVRSFALSPNGKSAAYAEPEEFPTIGMKVKIIDLESGDEQRSMPLSASLVNALAYSADGKMLAAACSDCLTRVFDSGTGKLIHPDKGHVGIVAALEYTPDGKHIVSIAADRSLRVWNAGSGKELASFDALGIGPADLAVVPDDEKVVCTNGNRTVLSADLAAVLRGDEHPFEKRELPVVNNVTAAAVAANGKVCAIATADGAIRFQSCSTGEEQGILRPQKINPRTPAPSASNLAFSPDNRFLAGRCSDGSARIWDVKQMQEIREIPGMDSPGPVLFSPDSCSLMTADQMLRLWERASGQVRWQFDITRIGGVRCLAFSPDRRLVAAGHADGTISVRSLASGNELASITAQQGAIQALRFSPDSQRLASGGADSTILIWDVGEQWKSAHRTEVKLGDNELRTLWRDLADSDAGKAYPAMDRIAAGGNAAVDFVKQNLKPAVAADEKTIAKLIKDLDADDVKARDDATSSLEEIGEPAAEPLQKLLDGSPPLEVRTRAQRIIDHLKTGTAAANVLRGLRALEVLEWIGTDNAAQLLHTYSRDEKTPGLAQEAKFALERLKRK